MGREPSRSTDPCGCVIEWDDLPNGHRVGVTVEECHAHSEPEDFDPADYIEVERP